MRDIIKNFLEIVTSYKDFSAPLYEFGSRQMIGQEDYADLRQFFPGKEYVGCDYEHGTGVDKIIDLHNTGLPDETVGTVLCFDTLEHVEYPHKAISEIHRILKKNGIVIISSIMDFPVHSSPYDYWRFTPEGFNSLLKIFDKSIVIAVGNEDYPHTVLGIGFKGECPDYELILKEANKWKLRWNEELAPFSLQSQIKQMENEISLLKEDLKTAKKNESIRYKIFKEIKRGYRKLFKNTEIR